MPGNENNLTRLYLWQIQALPDQVMGWRSQWISHGMDSYHHVGWIDAAYCANNNVTLQLQAFDGTSANNITLPSTGGAYQRVRFNPTFNKGMLYRYSANSNSPFQFVLTDWIAYVKQWGSAGPYQAYRLLGEG